MTEYIKEVVDAYHKQAKLVKSDEEQQRLAAAHQSFIDQLTPGQQAVARDAARPYLLEAVAAAERMEPVLQRAKDMLSRRQETV